MNRRESTRYKTDEKRGRDTSLEAGSSTVKGERRRRRIGDEKGKHERITDQKKASEQARRE